MSPDEYCQQKAAASGSSFYYSFLFLPPDRRRAITALYAFCREVDDVVDECADTQLARTKLGWWALEIGKLFEGNPSHPVTRAMQPHLEAFGISAERLNEIITGMEMDLTKKRYATFGELEAYCYRAASTVGLMCAEVFGYRNQGTKDYAVNLGIALQLTNILRDIKHDAKQGRIYLPIEDLREFGYSEEELLSCTYNERFVALMKFECDRAHQYFRKAKVALAEEDKPLFTAARIMGNIYFLLLRRIERVHYDVFTRRIRLSAAVKMLVAMTLRLRNHAPRNLHKFVRTELPA